MKKTVVNLFSGFLGVGKTTALRHLIAHRRAQETWAVIVNEFGEVGIDAAALSAGDLPVAEIAGGCLCCVAGPQMTATVATLLRRHRPDRLLIEASGLAHAAGVVDELRRKPLGDALSIGAVLTLVDPRQFTNPDYWRQPLYRDQVALADVLVANKTDLADVDTLEAFRRQARALFPAKARIEEVRRGELDADWLDVDGAAALARYRPAVERAAVANYASQGWVYPADVSFDGEALVAFFERLPQRVAGLVRAKGVFRVLDSWVWLNWLDGQWSAVEVAWRRDSRFEIIASEIDAGKLEADVTACMERQG